MAERRILREMVDMQFAEYTGLSCKDMEAEKTKRAWAGKVRAEQTRNYIIRRMKIEEIKILSTEYEAHQRDL